MSTNSTTAKPVSTETQIVTYYSLTLVIVGTVLNLLTFVILCRAPFRDTNNRAAMHYMRTIAVFDIFMLYGWNLNHYVSGLYGKGLLQFTVASCKFMGFISYFAPQTSAWLRVFLCMDRYVLLSRPPRTWINRSNSILLIIVCIILVFTLLNLHMLIFVCYTKPDGTVGIQAPSYKVYPMWDYVNLGVYNCAPFILMVTFNSGIIYHLVRVQRTSTLQNSRVQRRSIAITLVITTFLFLVMTIPATVAFAFFAQADVALLRFLDGLLYSHHILSFPLYMITFDEFRRECINLFRCNRCVNQIQPQTTVQPGA